MSMSSTNEDGIHFADNTNFPPLAPTCSPRRNQTHATPLTKRNSTISEKSVGYLDDKDERDIRKKQDFKGRYLFW